MNKSKKSKIQQDSQVRFQLLTTYLNDIESNSDRNIRIGQFLAHHLFLENKLKNSILDEMPELKRIGELSEKSNFRKKVNLISKLKIFSSSTIKTTETINTIRNNFVHNLDYTLTKEEIEAIYKYIEKFYNNKDFLKIRSLEDLLAVVELSIKLVSLELTIL